MGYDMKHSALPVTLGGGLALHWLAVTQLSWVGVLSMLIALLIVAIKLRRSREQKS
jgi:predicted MFS family arabinose efflux permease